MFNNYSNFWKDLEKILNKSVNYDLNILTDLIYDVYKKYFENSISIEISKNENNIIDIIFCGGHNKDMVVFISNLLDKKINIANYNIYGPKPALGFNFEININKNIVNGNNFLFMPLKNNSDIKKMGFYIYSPYKNIDENIVWKIIETGIGEEFASKIDYIKIKNEFNENYLPINKLFDYVFWFTNK